MVKPNSSYQVQDNFPPKMMSPPTSYEASFSHGHQTGHYLGNKWIGPKSLGNQNNAENYWTRQFKEQKREPSPYFKGLGDSPARECPATETR